MLEQRICLHIQCGLLRALWTGPCQAKTAKMTIFLIIFMYCNYYIPGHFDVSTILDSLGYSIKY